MVPRLQKAMLKSCKDEKSNPHWQLLYSRCCQVQLYAAVLAADAGRTQCQVFIQTLDHSCSPKVQQAAKALLKQCRLTNPVCGCSQKELILSRFCSVGASPPKFQISASTQPTTAGRPSDGKTRLISCQGQNGEPCQDCQGCQVQVFFTIMPNHTSSVRRYRLTDTMGIEQGRE